MCLCLVLRGWRALCHGPVLAVRITPLTVLSVQIIQEQLQLELELEPEPANRTRRVDTHAQQSLEGEEELGTAACHTSVEKSSARDCWDQACGVESSELLQNPAAVHRR